MLAADAEKQGHARDAALHKLRAVEQQRADGDKARDELRCAQPQVPCSYQLYV